jgi:hypothetical protein
MKQIHSLNTFEKISMLDFQFEPKKKSQSKGWYLGIPYFTKAMSVNGPKQISSSKFHFTNSIFMSKNFSMNHSQCLTTENQFSTHNSDNNQNKPFYLVPMFEIYTDDKAKNKKREKPNQNQNQNQAEMERTFSNKCT